MPYIITKEFALEAAHHLTRVPDGHKCKTPHGHSYRVVIELQAEELNDFGFVVDYNDLAYVKEWLDLHFDHKDLNVVFKDSDPPFEPTAENMARSIYDRFHELYPVTAVTVCETAKTSATYRP